MRAPGQPALAPTPGAPMLGSPAVPGPSATPALSATPAMPGSPAVPGTQSTPAAPPSAAAAMAMVHAGLDALNAADLGSLPAVVQADCLRGLEQIGSKYTAARSGIVSVFTAQGSYHDDGQHGPRPWLKWQTQVTGATAGTILAWSKRLDMLSRRRWPPDR